MTGLGCLGRGQPQHGAVVVRVRTPAGKQHDRDAHSGQRFRKYNRCCGGGRARLDPVAAGATRATLCSIALSDLSILSSVSFYRSLITI